MQTPFHYDPVLLRADLVRQHGSVIGPIAFDAQMRQRETEDTQIGVWTGEMAELNGRLAALAASAAERRLKAKRELEAAFAIYRAHAAKNAAVDELMQAEIAPLQSRALEIQRQISAVALSRSAEREVRNVVNYNSTNAKLLREIDTVLPPLAPPPPSALAQINSNVGHERDS
jgi:hypothetical protein